MASIQEELDKISVLVASLLLAQKNHNLPAFKAIEKDISTINESITSLKENIENIDTATKKEIQDSLSLFEEKVQSIKDLIPDLKDGETPSDEKLVSLIKPLIPAPEKGDKGDTPIAGIDFPLPQDGETPTEEELKAIIEPLIPVAKDGSPDTPAQIVEKLESLQDDDRLDVDAIRGVEELIDEKVSKIKTGDTNYYGGAGARSFTDLIDTPNTYVGQAGKVATVNATETGIEFTTPTGGGGAEQAVLDVSTSQSIATNQVVRADASTESITLTLTNPATLQTVTIKKVDTSENSVYVTSASLIDGDVIAELSTTDESITLKWTGTTYDII